ncbi:MAG: hypothetical protein QOC64_3229 [Solirubrobacteraceae bacterium]|nr:hypothetical protein [Solirubrobacteraceae bacterium]
MARVALIALIAVLVTAAPAAAQTTATALDDAAAALERGETVYVDPDARAALPEAEERDLEARISDAGGRIYAAVLPEGAGGTEAAFVLGNEVRRRGTYVVGAGDTWSAASDVLPAGAAGDLVEEAAQGRAGDAAAVLNAFVAAVATSQAAGEEDSGGGGVLIGVVAVLAAGGGLLAWRGSRRRRAREAAELEEVRTTAHDDLIALGDDVRQLELDVEMPGADPRAKERYGEAVGAYVRAEEALDLARRPADFKPIGQALEEGRWAMAAARARLAGEEEPERRAPCFFDPRHGPSVTDAEWQPELGEPRMVPVCAADAARLADGEQPTGREVTVGGRRIPYWEAPGQYAPFYAAGMFGAYGAILPALWLGSLAGDGGWGDGGGGDGGGGDGGGGWGGGDFGGGDFGGGDFGG